ncbi:MAG TPA: exodeoxyribonuclease VII small subunit [Tissierellaceae bacterium]|nr:exodeoxyribonuclease VII small subunit [Tissierellaceae bacterium]
MKIDELSYEEALDKLQMILAKLEKDETTLDQSLKLFQKGVELYKYCNKILTRAESEIKLLLDEDNLIKEVDYIQEEDDNY